MVDFWVDLLSRFLSRISESNFLSGFLSRFLSKISESTSEPISVYFSSGGMIALDLCFRGCVEIITGEFEDSWRSV